MNVFDDGTLQFDREINERYMRAMGWRPERERRAAGRALIQRIFKGVRDGQK